MVVYGVIVINCVCIDINFKIYFQSDLESCSEASESVGPNINKEQLVIAYQKIQQKYHKYKGRYSDLARHYRDLERDNKNAKVD